MNNKQIIFFAKVKTKFINDWEYYNNDIVMLKSFYSEVYISNNYFSFILDFIKYRNADVFCWWWYSSMPVLVLSKLFRRKNIFCTGAIHMFDYSGAPDFYSSSILSRIFNKISLRIATHNLFISKDQLISITSHLKVTNPILLYPSLSFKYKNEEYGNNLNLINNLNENEFNFLYFSWLTEDQVKRKGLFHLIDAFDSLVKESKCNLKLTIAGKDGGYLDNIKNYIKMLDANNFIFFKLNVSESEKYELYSKTDLLINPSFMEGFGNATLEAMSQGCPVLISRYGASCEVTGNTGYIVNDISSNEILDCLVNYTNLNLKERNLMRTKVIDRANLLFSFNKRIQNFSNILKQH